MILTRTLSGLTGRADPNGVVKPQLTSLIDVLTILLVFLLKSFSVEGTLVTPAEDLNLPESISNLKPVPTLNVEISTNTINVDGSPVADITAVAASDSLMIPGLYNSLQRIASSIGKTEEKQEVTIQCDRHLNFNVVKKVMYTCSQANYTDFAVLALQEEK